MKVVYWTLILHLSFAVDICEEQSAPDTAFTHVIAATDGMVYSPGYPNCGFKEQQAVTWKFAPTTGLVVIKFDDFDLPSCSSARMKFVNSNGANSYCGEITPGDILWGHKVSITLNLFAKNCGRGIALLYTSPQIFVDVTTPVTVGETQMKISIPNLPDEISASCKQIIYDDEKVLTLTSKPTILLERLSPSGTVRYSALCDLQESKTFGNLGKIILGIDIEVHDDIQLIDISIIGIENCLLLTKEVSITIELSFAYPVTLHIFLRDLPDEPVTRSISYTEEMMTKRPALITEIKLPWINKLKPGKHDAVLVIENGVSARTLTFPVNFCERLTLIHLLPIKYIDIFPAMFTVTIQIPKGSPATVDISLKNKQDTRISANATTCCSTPQECRTFSVQMSVPFKGVFSIVATARNSLGMVESTMRPVKSFPLVHNLYVTSSFPIKTTSPGIFYVLYKIPSNRGTFQIELSTNGWIFSKQIVPSHVPFEEAERTLPNFRFPFNPTEYKVYTRSHLFIRPGNYKISVNISTENRKQSLKAWTEIYVVSALAETCLTGVKIRDGRKGKFLTEIFNGTAPVILTADVDISCDIPDGERFQYQWNVYKAKSLDEAPDSSNELQLSGLRTSNPELYVDPRNTQPGFYFFRVLLSQKDKYGSVVLRVNDFVSMKTPELSLEAQICGAYQREICSDVTEIEFDAACSGNKLLTGIQYTWFCAISREDLPPQKELGMFLNKGSCFGWKPQFMDKRQKIRLSLSDVATKKGFFARVFLSLKGYNDVFADQQIIPLSHRAPIVNLQCWSNCGREVKSSDSLLLRAQCDTCILLKWHGDKEETGNFYKIIAKDLQKLKGTVIARVTGTDKHGRKSTAVFQKQIADYPLFNVKILPKGTVPINTKVTLTLESKESLLIRISASVKLDQPFTLVQYGYEKTVTDIYVSGAHDQPFSYFKIEACSLNGICSNSVGVVKMNYLNKVQTEDPSVLEKKLIRAIKGRNTQEVVKQALQLTTIDGLSNEMQKEILRYGLYAPLVSTESAKQSLDLLYYGINVEELSGNELKIVVSRLSKITSIVQEDMDLSSYASETFLDVTMHLASKILQSTKKSKMDSSLSQRTLTTVLGELSQNILRETYKDGVTVFTSPVIRSSMFRFHRGSDMRGSGEEVSVSTSSCEENDVEISDLMIFEYKSSPTKFETRTGSPDEVVGVLFISNRKIPGEMRPRTESFIPQTPVHFSLEPRGRPKKFSDVRLNPKNQTTLDPRSSETTENLWHGRRLIAIQGEQGSIVLKIVISLSDEDMKKFYELEYVRLDLEKTKKINTNNFLLTKMIEPSEMVGPYTWTLPFTLMGENILDLKIEVKSPFPVYSVKVLPYAIRCSFWDDDINDWNSRKCMVSETSTAESRRECQCDLQNGMPSLSPTSRSSMHLFSTRLVVYPNKINKTKMNPNDIENNPVIVITVILMYVIFAFGFYFARKMNRKDMERPPYIEVCDDMPNEEYRYLVTVFTGSRCRAGPTSTVTITLIGNNGRVIHLLQKFGKKNILLRGSVITFLMTAPSCLGDVGTIRIWHGNEGDSPDWYLNRLVVRDYETDECWFFLVNAWLSGNSDKIDITVNAATMSELHSFYSLLAIKCLRYLKDRHLWYSMFAMGDPWSIHNMTRTQRLACCMLLVFMLMATSILFYEKELSLAVDLGILSLQWSDITAGLQSGALCFPGTYIVSLIFRSSRRRQHHLRSHEASYSTLGQTGAPTPSSGNEYKRKKILRKHQASKKLAKEIRRITHNDSTTQHDTSCEEDNGRKLSGRKTSRKSQLKVVYVKTKHRDSDSPVTFFSCCETSDEENAGSIQVGDKIKPRVASRKYHDRKIPLHETKQKRRKKEKKEPSSREEMLRSVRDDFNELLDQLFAKELEKIDQHSTLKKQFQPIAPSARKESYRPEQRDQTQSNVHMKIIEESVIKYNPKIKASISKKRQPSSPTVETFVNSFSLTGIQGTSSNFRTGHSEIAIVEVDPDSIDHKPLPWFCVYIGWFIVIFIVISCSLFDILCGITYGLQISMQWMVSFLTAAILCIFVLEPVKAILLAYFVAVARPMHDIKDWIPPLRTEVLPRRHENEARVIKNLRCERNTNRSYRAPNDEKNSKSRI